MRSGIIVVLLTLVGRAVSEEAAKPKRRVHFHEFLA